MFNYILKQVEKIVLKSNELSPQHKELIFEHVSFALEQTRAYISSSRKNGSDKSSSILSNIWQRTARNIKAIENPDVRRFVKTIEEKARYWSDPNSYDKEQFDNYNMRIFQVETTLKQMCK